MAYDKLPSDKITFDISAERSPKYFFLRRKTFTGAFYVKVGI